MRLLVLSSAPLISSGKNWMAYSPYVKEMEVWARHVDEVWFCCPIWETDRGLLTSRINFKTAKPIRLMEFELTSFVKMLKSLYAIMVNLIRIYKAIQKAEHIHLRCPGNIGLLACIVQVFFPHKVKTTKYAGNWDPKAKQPWSYRLQKWILSNTFFTQNMQVLVYGEWRNQSCNIKSFFTATYTEKDKKPIYEIDLKHTIRMLFVGTLSKGKNPLYAVQLVKELFKKGYDVQLRLYGEGTERGVLENYIHNHHLDSMVELMGNRGKEEIREAYAQSHFLILPSQSEGWPKVVAEAMFWGCVPVSSPVSCVANMLGNGTRGLLLEMCLETDVMMIESLMNDFMLYRSKRDSAVAWSRAYTLDYFESEIQNLLKSCE